MSYKSLIQILRSKGPKSDLSSTPESMTKGDESIRDERTQDCLLVRQLRNQFR
jgi:hypothetical protein